MENGEAKAPQHFIKEPNKSTYLQKKREGENLPIYTS
jgi:hypothetical protein